MHKYRIEYFTAGCAGTQLLTIDANDEAHAVTRLLEACRIAEQELYTVLTITKITQPSLTIRIILADDLDVVTAGRQTQVLAIFLGMCQPHVSHTATGSSVDFQVVDTQEARESLARKEEMLRSNLRFPFEWVVLSGGVPI